MKPQFKYIETDTYFNSWKNEWIEWEVKRYRHRWGGYYRAIKTFSERKQSNAHKADGYSNLIRARRNSDSLPSTWDDICVSRCYGKSWKDFTKAKKQYLKNS